MALSKHSQGGFAALPNTYGFGWWVPFADSASDCCRTVLVYLVWVNADRCTMAKHMVTPADRCFSDCSLCRQQGTMTCL